jgi:hypothetical protein
MANAETFEFQEVIEAVEAEASEVASTIARLANDPADGRRLRGVRSARFMEGMAYAARLYKDVLEGKRRWYVLKEAMTTSDFPLYMAGVLDRGLLGTYAETPSTWQAYCSRALVRDFREREEYAFDGLEGALLEVKQQSEYPEAALSETRYKWAVKKYGRRVPYSWESYINDDLEVFGTIPGRLSKAARRSEDKFATQLHVDANGPHATFYSTANKNRIHSENFGSVANPALSIAALQQAWGVISKFVDTEGEPILFNRAILEVPPALEVTANNIVNALQIVATEAGGTSAQTIWARNWMAGRLQVVVNPYIPVIATTNGHTSWFLHASPSEGRPAFRMGFLRGYEAPGLYVKSPNARRAGGGDVDPFEGDFDTDTIEQKVRAVFGGTRLDPKASAASNGSGA